MLSMLMFLLLNVYIVDVIVVDGNVMFKMLSMFMLLLMLMLRSF